jgi:hypothetical protein
MQQDHQADSRTEDREASSQIVHWAAGSESLDIVEESTPMYTEEETTSGLHVNIVGAPPTSRIFLQWWCTDRLLEMSSLKKGEMWYIFFKQ